METRLITENRYRYMPLLLLADPDRSMIMRYFVQGEMYVCFDRDAAVGVCVMLKNGAREYEIKNLAVAKLYQRKGIGGRLLEDVVARYAGKFEKILVGTSDVGAAFYQKHGFEFSHIVKNFYVDNYPHPIFEENGQQCIDMIYFVRKI